MKTWVSSICLSVALAACSQAHVPQRSRIASGELVTCKQVTPTGSHLPRTVCTSAAEREQQQASARAIIEEEQRRRMAEDAMRQTFERQSVPLPNRP